MITTIRAGNGRQLDHEYTIDEWERVETLSKKKNKNWFETLCTMDDSGTGKNSAGANRKRTTAGNRSAKSRVRISNQNASPYEEDDIPPFRSEDDEAVSVGEHIFDDMEDGRGEHRSTSRPKSRGTSSGKRTSTTGARSGGKASSRSSSSRSKNGNKPLPADLAYRMQPYFVLFFGVLLGLMLVLSATLSGGTFAWETDTHPFRFIGYHIENILFGLLGYGAYLLPAAMVYLSVLRAKEGREYRSAGRSALAAGILVLFPAIIHTGMISAGEKYAALNTFSVKQLYLAGADKQGGGVLGGLLGTLCDRGLGVIATMIIGIVLLLVLLVLLLGLTPAGILRQLRAWRAARIERAEEARELAEREAARKEAEARAAEKAAAKKAKQSLPPARTATKASSGVSDIANEEEDEFGLLSPVSKSTRRASRKQDAEEEPTLRRGAVVHETEPKGQEEYLDPMTALLSGASRRRDKKQEIALPDTVFPDQAPATPMEYVGDPVLEQIFEMPKPKVSTEVKASAPIASTVPEQFEPEDPSDAETMVDYPDRAEIALDETTEDTVLPLDVDEKQDYQSGFDYSMESAEDAEDVEEDTDGVEMIGGVAVRIDRLSEEERMRGETIAPPEEEEEPAPRPYTYPRVDLLDSPKPHNPQKEQEVRVKMQKLNATLTNFKVRVDGMSYVCGPAVTRYEVRPAPGVRVRAIANLADDIAMNLAAKSIRIEAPIPGKDAVGIEVPNATRETVYLRRLIDSEDFRGRSSKLTACLGEDVAGEPILFDIVKMPHLLVAGTTGSGKSVCINDFLMSLLFKATPQEVKIILIDPKQVEFTVYKDLPHLMAPIVCDPKRAAAALNLAVLEMEKRFQLIKEVGVRKISDYNKVTENDRYERPYMPNIVIVIDELADLMMQAKDEVESSIVRLAQKGRAAGIHLIIGTQRPSVDVITGLIKANVPSRIACTVVSQVDSRTILDVAGAEKLLGMGDMLYAPIGSPKPLRVQGAFVSDDEVERIVDFIKRNNDPVRYDQEFLDNLDREAQMIGTKRQSGGDDDDMGEEGVDGMDPKFYEALRIAIDNKRISTSLLQRMLSIGYGRAAKIIDQMERMGFVGPAVGNKPREIRITEQGFAELMMNRE